MQNETLRINISRSYIRNINCFIIFILFINLAVTIYADYFAVEKHLFTDIFSVHSESSLHNWISSFILGLVALLAFVVGTNIQSSEKLFAWFFYLFGLMSLGMAADEEAKIHETIGNIYHQLTTSGVLALKPGYWLTAYSPLIVSAVFFLIYFMMKVRNRYPDVLIYFVAALLLWICAVGIEFLDGRFKSLEYPWSKRAAVRYMTEYAEVVGSYFFMLTMVKCLKIQNEMQKESRQ